MSISFTTLYLNANCSTPRPTPITPITFRNRTIYIKRDDLLQTPPLHGNKARKFHALIHSNPPPTALLSYGGPHSNAMLALASLAHHFKIPFTYLTRPQPPYLHKLPGNFASAVQLGMRHYPLPGDQFRQLFSDQSPRDAICNARSVAHGLHEPVIVPQGGACPMADIGVRKLAEELAMQISEMRSAGMLTMKRPVLFLAAGTGTTAYYLNKYLTDVAKVVAVPVSGDERYLVKQMRWLHEIGEEDRGAALPGVLRPRLRGTFADVREDKLKIWREMKRAAEDIDFDLIYAPKAWEEVMLAVDEGRLGTKGEDLIYYHSGGTEGNVSMLGRWWHACQARCNVRRRAMQRGCTANASSMCSLPFFHAFFLHFSQQGSSRRDFSSPPYRSETPYKYANIPTGRSGCTCAPA